MSKLVQFVNCINIVSCKNICSSARQTIRDCLVKITLHYLLTLPFFTLHSILRSMCICTCIVVFAKAKNTSSNQGVCSANRNIIVNWVHHQPKSASVHQHRVHLSVSTAERIQVPVHHQPHSASEHQSAPMPQPRREVNATLSHYIERWFRADIKHTHIGKSGLATLKTVVTLFNIKCE